MAVVGALVAKLSLAHAAFTRGCRTAAGSVTVLGRASRVASGGVRMLGSALAMAVGPIMGFYAAFRMLKITETFQQEMNSALAIVDSMTPKLRKAFEKQAKDLSFQLKYSAAEVAKGYYYLFSAGLTPEQSLAAMPTTARFAQAAMIDMAEATDILTDAVTSLGLDSKDTATYLENLNTVADKIAMTATKANASIAQFGQAVTNKAGASMKAMNIPLSEGLAILAAFASQAKKGEDAGTAFSIVLRDLTYMAIQNTEALEGLGVDVFDDRGGVRYIGMLEDLSRALAGLSPEQKTKVLIDIGLPKKSSDFTKMLLGMGPMMREIEEAADNAGGTVERVTNRQLSDFTAGMKKLRAVIHALAIDNLTEPMQSLGRALTLLLEATTSWNTALGETPSAINRVTTELEGMEAVVGNIADGLHAVRRAWLLFRAIGKDAKYYAQMGMLPPEKRATTELPSWRESNKAWQDLEKTGAQPWPSEKMLTQKSARFSDKQLAEAEKRKGSPTILAQAREMFNRPEEAYGLPPEKGDYSQAFDDLEKFEERQRQAMQVFDQTRTPMERFRKEAEDLFKLLDVGAFKGAGGMETYIRALTAAMDDFDSSNVDNQLAALEQLFEEGLMSWEAFEQAVGRAVIPDAAKQKTPDVQAPTLARSGSQEAYDLIRRNRDPKQTEGVQQKQLVVQTQAAATLVRVEAVADAIQGEMSELSRALEALEGENIAL